jgi:hypothetical protein
MNFVVDLRLDAAIGADGADQFLGNHLNFMHRQPIPRKESRHEEDDDNEYGRAHPKPEPARLLFLFSHSVNQNQYIGLENSPKGAGKCGKGGGWGTVFHGDRRDSRLTSSVSGFSRAKAPSNVRLSYTSGVLFQFTREAGKQDGTN